MCWIHHTWVWIFVWHWFDFYKTIQSKFVFVLTLLVKCQRTVISLELQFQPKIKRHGPLLCSRDNGRCWFLFAKKLSRFRPSAPRFQQRDKTSSVVKPRYRVDHKLREFCCVRAKKTSESSWSNLKLIDWSPKTDRMKLIDRWLRSWWVQLSTVALTRRRQKMSIFFISTRWKIAYW